MPKRVARTALLLSFLFAFPDGAVQAQTVAAGQGLYRHAQPQVLVREVQFRIADVPLRNAVGMFMNSTDVSVVHSPSLIPNTLVSCDCIGLPLATALSRMLDGTGLGYEVQGDQIVLRPVVGTSRQQYTTLPAVSVGAGDSRVTPLPLITGTLTGRVRNAATLEGLGSAQVQVVGTTLGTLTGPDGRFTIPNVPAGDRVIEVVMLGFRAHSQTVAVRTGETAVIEIRLYQQAIALDEVVVTGTAGAAARRELGNSVGTVSAERLSVVQGGTISEALQGTTAGLQFFSQDGQVGSGSTIVLRGIRSVSQGSEPLIYVDGVRVSNPVFAANTFTGVTSAGNPGSEGAQTSPKPLDALNRSDIERVEVIRGAAATTLYGTEAAGGVIQIFTKRGAMASAPTWTLETSVGQRFQTANGLGPIVGNDPEYLGLKQFLRHGTAYGLSGSVRGGTDALRYYLSASNDYEEGVVPNNYSERYSVRGNFGFQPHRTLNAELNASFATRSSEFAESGDNTYGLLLNIFRGSLDYTGGEHAILFDIENASTDDRFVGGVTFTHTPMASLVNRLTVGLDYTSAFNRQTIPFGFKILPDGRREVNRWTNRILSIDYAGTMSNRFGSNVSSAFSWGGQIFSNLDHAQFATAERFGGPGDKTIRSGATTRADETELRIVNAGFFVQEVLGLSNRAFVTAGFRADGNSAFGEALGLQVYPKISASWVISEEEFFPESFGMLRLRAAIGESGKAPGAFDAVRTWVPVAGYDGRPGVSPGTVGNENLGPERSRELELGFESSILNDRVSGELNWFRSVTRDALFAVPAPPSQGFLNSPLRNVGEMENRGIELTLNTVPLDRPRLRWEVGGTYSTSKSEVLDLAGNAPFNVGFASMQQWIREGYPAVAAFGRRVTNPDDLAEPVWENDVYLGPIYPTHYYSLTTSVTFGGRLTLFALGQGSGGNVLANNMARQGVNRGLWPECIEQPERASQTALWRARCMVNSDLGVWFRPADILRVRTVSLAWRMPSNLIPRASDATLMLSAQNLWRSQDYTGLDPELSRGGRFSVAPGRYEYYQLPPPQSVTLSLRTTF